MASETSVYLATFSKAFEVKIKKTTTFKYVVYVRLLPSLIRCRIWAVGVSAKGRMLVGNRKQVTGG